MYNVLNSMGVTSREKAEVLLGEKNLKKLLLACTFPERGDINLKQGNMSVAGYSLK